MAETANPPVCAVHVASRGPRFYRAEDGRILFKITLDGRSSIGPRPMVDADQQQYPQAWQAFISGEPSAAEPLKRPIETIDHPNAKAAHDADQAEHQRRLDARRGGGL